MKLIPLDAVLAEIEKLHNQHISPNYVDEAGLVLEQLEDDNSFEELLQEIYVKYNKEIPIEKLLDIASNIAKWQKKQDKMVEKLMEKNYATGFEAHKQQMIKEAITGQLENGEDYLRIKCLYTSCRPLDDGKLVKLIIIKED